MYATFDNKGFHIFENNVTIQIDELPDISSNQEEADAKIFLFAEYCVWLGVDTADTDVLVLSFYYSTHVNNHLLTLTFPVYVNIIGKSEEHWLNLSKVDQDIGMRRALPGLHAVTGCDSVSAFFRRGKIKGF